MTRLLALALVGLLSPLLVGCGSVFPKPRPSRLYVLTSLSPSGDATDRSVRTGRGAASADGRPLSIGIGPIRWPGYLDRQEIIIRVEPNRFKVLEDDRWAEPLDENFLRVLMQNLSASLRTDQIFVYPWPRNKKPSYRLDIEVLRLESTSAAQAQLTARWTITDVDDNDKTVSNEFQVVRQAKDDSISAAVAALSEAVADLGSEIAAALMKQADFGRQTTSESAASKRN